MLEFREININDKEWIDDLLKKSDFMGCEYSFANNMAWRRMNNSLISRFNDFYIVKAEDENYVYYTFPAGKGKYSLLFDALEEYADHAGKGMIFTGVTDYGLFILDKYSQWNCIAEKSEDYSDYIYLADDLINLKGKKYHKKRNHLSKINNYNWEFHPMTPDDFDECIAFSAVTYNNKNGYDDHSSVAEQFAIHTYFSYFEEMGLKGGVITIDNKIKAFTIGEQLNSKTLCVHIEKADPTVNGLYPAINNEFVKYAAGDLIYVNREEDLGIDGLRQAKRSYFPVFMVDKYNVKINKK
ncbi:DUF2156 domain-containing protein [Porcipelethomonas sp.]|uniref:DUF2156 domain-containing protein n=1 Tax=Porcipelethomonas sp. TaxID=2981675 RepID=UPI003EF916EC